MHCGLTDCLSSFKSKFIYISSDSVINPVNFYSKTKYLGEEICRLNNGNSIIVRTNIYGFNSSSGNSLVEWALDGLKRSESITGFSDVIFNAVYTKQLVESVYHLIQSGASGYINVGGNYSVSKFLFLKKLCQVFEYDTNLILEGKLSDVNKDVKRPLDTTLGTKSLNYFGINLNLDIGLNQLKNDMGKL